MKLFKPLYIYNVEYTGVNFIKSSRKGYKSYKRHNCIAIYPYSDEARLVEELADKVKSRVQWLVDWLYANIRPTSSVYNRWGWREGFTLPKQRPFGKLKEIA